MKALLLYMSTFLTGAKFTELKLLAVAIKFTSPVLLVLINIPLAEVIPVLVCVMFPAVVNWKLPVTLTASKIMLFASLIIGLLAMRLRY